MVDPVDAYNAVTDEVGSVLVGNEEIVERLMISLLTRGHVLLEGVPGVAKTTTANLFASAMGVESQRIQMTPDILPADITGTHVYREQTGEFQLQRGPIFSNIVITDEINRATPKTQSALLEAMQEEHVTIEGETLPLPEPFMVIATQNPIEMEGTFELPEAQRDRFQFKLVMEIPERADEAVVLDRFNENAMLGSADVEQVLSPGDIDSLRDQVADVHVASAVQEYILDIVQAVRESQNVEVGASPRASLTFLHTAKARALLHGREYVIPDDVKALAIPILRHRLILSTEAELSDMTPLEVIEDVLDSVVPPGSASFASPEESQESDVDSDGEAIADGDGEGDAVSDSAVGGDTEVDANAESETEGEAEAEPYND